MKIKKIISVLVNDWFISALLLLMLSLSFFAPEQKWTVVMNWVYIITGFFGLAYIFYALYILLIDKIKLDLLWVRNKFLHKVVNLVLLVPFTITIFFIVCNIDDIRTKSEKIRQIDKIEKNKRNDELETLKRIYKDSITSLQSSFAKELVFSDNLYAKHIDTIHLGKDSLLCYSHKYVAELSGWEIVMDYDGSYCLVKEIDKLPQNIINKTSEEPSLFWSVYYHYIDSGNQHIATTEAGRRWAAVASISGYILLNGLLVAVLIGWFDRRRMKWEHGEVEYTLFRFKKHHVVIGANDMVYGIVKELIKRYPSDYIIILTSREVGLFRRELFSDLEEEKQEKVIIYYGNRTSRNDISKLYLEKSGVVCILGESLAIDGQNHDAFNMNCLRLMTDCLPKGVEKKNVYVIFENQVTFSSFQFSDISKEDKEKINYIPYNYYEMWTQKTLAFPDPTGILDDKKHDVKEYDYLPLDTIREIDEETREEKLSYISKDDSHYVHLVIIGMTKMGVAMGIEAAHLAHYPNALTSKAPRTRMTFIDENADRESGYFMNRYSAMFALARWRYAEADKFNQRTKDAKNLYSNFDLNDETWHDPLHSENSTSPYKDMKLGADGTNAGDEFFIDLEWEFIKGDMSNYAVQQYLGECADKKKHPNKILTVAVCLEEPHQAIAAGLYMPDAVYENSLQILVYQRFSDSILHYIEDSALKGKSLKYRNVKPFGMLRDTFYMISTDDYLAKCINYIYTYTDYSDADNKKIYDKERDVFKSEIMMNVNNELIDKCWNDTLSDFRKGKSGCASRWSSIYNANTIKTKLRSVKWDGKELDKGNEDTITAMAMTEHNRWNVEQLLMHYSPVKPDELLELERLHIEDKARYKIRKDELKLQMRHIDICSYRRLEELDSGVEIYDISISRSLPCIVEKYKEMLTKKHKS